MSQANNNTNARPIYLNGRQVAVLRDDRLLDIRKHNDHFFYQQDENGEIQALVCIATETLRQARHANILQVTNIEKQIKYTISRPDFDRRSFDFEISRKTGFEEQRGCYLKYFASDAPQHMNYPIHVEAEPLAKPESRQLSLLDMSGNPQTSHRTLTQVEPPTDEDMDVLHLFFLKHREAYSAGRMKEFIDGLQEAPDEKEYLQAWK